jgi:hypothetical protein
MRPIPEALHPTTNQPEPREPPPYVDLTVGDFGDISKVKRDHPLLRGGRASDISPVMNNTRLTNERIAFEFNSIHERLNLLEKTDGGNGTRGGSAS